MTSGNQGRLLPEADYLALKAALRRLVRSAGGQESASAVTRVDHQRLSKYGNASQPMQAPVDVIADLERDTGLPAVTQVLAQIAGYDLVPRAAGSGAAIHPTKMLADIGRESADSMRVLADAIADGVVTPREAVDIRRELLELSAAVSGVVAAMDGLINGPAS